MENAVLKIENLSHRYSVQWAVKDISFEIPERGIFGLLGSNGAGKSTIMNIMCGVLRPTQGNVWIKGISMTEHAVEAKRYIGFLPQNPPVQTELTVNEYLSYCAGLRDVPRREVQKAVDKVMDRCAISHFKKRVIKNLSGGYRQRVGIAQAIIHNPDFVVLDEPTNGLDPNQILEIRRLVKEIAEERTVMLSTHMLSEVQALCNDIRMIEQGHVVFAGTVDDFNNYITPNSAVATLMAMPTRVELLKLPGVIRVEELGGPRYRLFFERSSDALEQIVETCVNRGWRLTEINLEKSSLNDIFAELSKK
ncbi:ABC transporter ATP-binding protein [Butyricimonas synergistica]|uniref:ABC transporter ATP-binding protein n=1 Tax=Butyricimonas synergistica TaxID=544644 RepID=UPI00036CE483|nr:ABC transporter ATP-binding protein [Butyricimonas synergistica]